MKFNAGMKGLEHLHAQKSTEKFTIWAMVERKFGSQIELLLQIPNGVNKDVVM